MDIEKIIDGIVLAEGGYINDPKDAGGATRYGITESVAKANGYQGDMKELPMTFARQVYKNQYYLVPKFDQVAAIAPEVAAELIDIGVNMGTGFAKTTLQGALNFLNRQGSDYRDIAEDGAIGAGTIAALSALVAKRGMAGQKMLLKTIIIMRGARYLAICQGNPVQEAFLYGWLDGRVHFTV